MINPTAYFDILSICIRLQKKLNEPSFIEVSLFGYLSCLLWLYKGQPVSNWGYSFALTQEAFAFSPDIQYGIEALRDMGFIKVKDEAYLQITPEGEVEYNEIKTFLSNAEREPFLDGACSSLLVLPYGVIRNGLQVEPDIKSTMALSQSRSLLTSTDIDSLHDQFSILSHTIGIETNDLMIPAVVWLKYLTEVDNIQI